MSDSPDSPPSSSSALSDVTLDSPPSSSITVPGANSDSPPSSSSALSGANSDPTVDPTASSTTASQDRSQLLAQATRFLTSARVQGDASDESKQEFLRSKGLSESEIDQVVRDAKSPVHKLLSVNRPTQPETDDDDAFQRAAKQFDDPINASLTPPPKNYPKSPLALYYEPPVTQPASKQSQQSPLTRYQVLLRFFKSLSYMMMLGGGVTAILVALHRTYILPRIVSMFDARSIVLKHHTTLIDQLKENVNSLATYTPIISSSEKVGPDGQSLQQRKGVLKKVHFGDQVNGRRLGDEKSQQQNGDNNESTETKEQEKQTESTNNSKTETTTADGEPTNKDDTDAQQNQTPPSLKIESIDVMEPIRKSLSRLSAVLKADRSSTALGTAISIDDVSSSTTGSPSRPNRQAMVQDESSDSDESEEWQDEEASDDGLEFDPYGSYQKKKHSQTAISVTSLSSSTSKAASLLSSLSELTTDIHSQSFSAAAASNSHFSNLRFGVPTPSSTSTSTSTSNAPEAQKNVDIAQIRAEIRSLKGLLLSRRNFPSFARPSAVPSLTQPDSNRSTSTVV